MALLADNAIPYEFLFNLTQAGRCRPPGAKLTSVDVHRLSIEVIERVLEYAPETYAEWRDPDWWEAEAWRDFIPRSEWHRVLTHMKNQAIGGYHFVEVMYMRVVEAEGLNWEYESYDFFEPPTGRAARSDSGYAKMVAAFGEKKLARLQEAAGRYRLAYGDLAATPDIFVYRHDGAEVAPVRFVEVKHKDAMRQRQLLGLALIQDILESPVEVVRFVSAGTRRVPGTYRGDWPRGGFIRPV